MLKAPHNTITYSLIGDSTAIEYFMIDKDTGYVSLKKSVVLDRDRRTQYNVSNTLLRNAF